MSMTQLQPAGMHHVSALSRDIRGTHAFFTRVLGMRLVIRTVNQYDLGSQNRVARQTGAPRQRRSDENPVILVPQSEPRWLFIAAR